MTRFLDSLASTLTGMLLATLMLAIAAPQAFEWSAAPRPASEPSFSPAPARTEAPTVIRCLATAQPVLGRITPSPAIGKRPAPAEAPETAASLSGIASMPAVDDAEARTAAGTLSGIATWFRSPAHVSAAGPDLRAALGPGWRGTVVTVSANGRAVVTQLGDWMAADKLIDLDAPLFVAVCGPLSKGICKVGVSW